jgi:uncharacterized membrane protein
MAVVRNLRENATGVLAMLILGAGLTALFLPALSPVPFWVIFIVGYAVVLPLFAMLFEGDDETEEERERPASPDESALETLKRRYAEGTVSDEEFERRLERLLETEDEGRAAEYVARRRRETGTGSEARGEVDLDRN